MATNRDLLKEAIADAKSVKEVAIANAKLALEEAFTPFLKDQLSAKLQEMDDEDVKKEEIEEVEEVTAEGKKKEDEVVKEDEVNLDELLAELEESEEIDEAKNEDVKEDVKEDARTDAEEEGFLDGKKDEKEDMEDEMDDEEIDLEDMSEDDLKGFIEDVIKDMVADGEIEPGDEFVEDDMETAVDVELDEAKEEIDEKKKQGYNARLDDAEGAKHGKKKQDMKQRRADSENMEKALGGRKFAGDSKMKEELAEAYATVKTLKSELNEINLLNAKLLYTNKIFKSKNLSESQKVKVLESFDKATSVKEAKLVFETVNSGLKSKKTYVNENLGRASKAAGIAVKKTAKQPIVESDEMVKRFQKLAGIL